MEWTGGAPRSTPASGGDQEQLCSTQRPDTLVRDPNTPTSPIPLATHRRSIHVGHNAPSILVRLWSEAAIIVKSAMVAVEASTVADASPSPRSRAGAGTIARVWLAG